MVDSTPCVKCGYRGFSLWHRPPIAARRFLWWQREALPEAMMFKCLRCFFEEARPLNTPVTGGL